MRKLLYVVCELKPVENSHSLTVASAFLNEYLKWNPNDEIHSLDLYRDYIQRIDADVLGGLEKINQGDVFAALTDDEQRKLGRIWRLADQFIAADKYVFVTPLWHIGFPAELKMYIDAICVVGKTIQYTPDGPKGLLEKQGKKCLHIHTSNKRPLRNGENHDVSYFNFMMNFMGIKEVKSIVIKGNVGYPVKSNKSSMSAMKKALNEAGRF